jgi:hypothetical protein
LISMSRFRTSFTSSERLMPRRPAFFGGRSPHPGAGWNVVKPASSFAAHRKALAAGNTYNAPTGAPTTGIGSAVATSTGVIAAASITPYDATGTFTLDFDTLVAQAITGGFGDPTNASTQAGATFQVVYTYTPAPPPAPEPATVTLFGSALLGVGFLARKRNRKA